MTPEACNLEDWLQKSSSDPCLVGELLAQLDPRVQRSSSGSSGRPAPRAPATKSPQLLWNRAILQCRAVEDFASIIARFGPQFDAVNVATLLHQAAKVAPRQVRGQPFFFPLFQRAIALLDADAFNAQALANTLWSLAKIFSALSPPEAREKLGGLVAPLMLRATSRAREFRAQNVSNTLWALAKLGATCAGGTGDEVLIEPLVEALTPVALAQISDFTPQNVSNSLWGLCKLAPRSAVLIEALLVHGAAVIDAFSPQHLSNSVWALATALGSATGRPSEAAVTAFLGPWRAKTASCVADFNSQDLSNCLWACVKLLDRLPAESSVCAALLARTRLLVNEFNPLYVASTLWALAVLSGEDDEALARDTGRLLLARLNVATLANLACLEDVVQCVFAFARLNGGATPVPGELLERVFMAANLDPNLFLARPDLFACAMAAWADGEVSLQPLLQPLVQEDGNGATVPQLPSDPDHLVLLTAALARLQLPCSKHSLALVRALSEHVVAELLGGGVLGGTRLRPRHAVAVCLAFASMEIHDMRLFASVAETLALALSSDCLSPDLWAKLAETLWPVRSDLAFWPHVLAKFLTLVYCPVLDRLRRVARLVSASAAPFPVPQLGPHFLRDALKDLQLLDLDQAGPPHTLADPARPSAFALVWRASDGTCLAAASLEQVLALARSDPAEISVVFETTAVPTLAAVEQLVAAGVRKLALSGSLQAETRAETCMQVSTDEVFEVRDAGYLPVNGSFADEGNCSSCCFGASVFRQRKGPGRWGAYGLFRWRDDNGEFVWYLSDVSAARARDFPGTKGDASDTDDLFMAKEVEECRPPSVGWKALQSGPARFSAAPVLSARPVWLCFAGSRVLYE